MEGGDGREDSSACSRNWAMLARDVLIVIFLKLGTMEVLRAAGSVCRSWRKVATEEPVLWRRIRMINHGYFGSDAFKLVEPARIAIDRSGGQLEWFAAANFADDNLLQYLCDRHTRYNMPPPDPDNEEEISNDDEALGIAKSMHQLRHLELIGNRLTNEGLTAILDGCPHLETLDIRQCFNVDIYDDGLYARCVRLKTFWFDYPDDEFDHDIDSDFDVGDD